MLNPPHENRHVVYENSADYKKDSAKEQEFDGVLRKVYHEKLAGPPGSIGPEITIFYKFDSQAPPGPIGSINEKVLYSHAGHNKVLDEYCGYEMRMFGKLTKDGSIWPGYLVPLRKVEEADRIEVCANEAWYQKDSDQINDYTGKLTKIAPITVPPGGGHGPVVTHFYQLMPHPLLGHVGVLEMLIFTNGEHNKVLDKYCNDKNDVRITGKVTKGELYPGYLTPLDDVNPGGPIILPGGQGGVQHGEPIEYVVFADDAWYKKDHDKVQSWSGKLIQQLSPTITNPPGGGGPGPVVTHFYALELSFAHPIVTKTINSNRARNDVLEKFLNKEVRIIGKLTDNEICPGYLSFIHTCDSSSSSDIVEPRITVCADTEWYKEDKDKVQEWTGTLQKFVPTTPLPPPGTTHFERVFYQLHLYFRPPIILEENLALYTHGKQNDVLEQHLDKKVKLIGKYNDTKQEILPGYLVPLLGGGIPNTAAH